MSLGTYHTHLLWGGDDILCPQGDPWHDLTQASDEPAPCSQFWKSFSFWKSTPPTTHVPITGTSGPIHVHALLEDMRMSAHPPPSVDTQAQTRLQIPTCQAQVSSGLPTLLPSPPSPALL